MLNTDPKRNYLPGKVHVTMHDNRVWNWRAVPPQLNKAIHADLMVAIEIQKENHAKLRREKMKQWFIKKYEETKKISVFEDFAKKINLDKYPR